MLCLAHSDDPVRWTEVVDLYDLLAALDPSPVVRLNRALARARTADAAVALGEVDALALSTYHPWHVARAHLLEQLDRHTEAADALDAALALEPAPLERAYLRARRGRS